MGMRTRLFPLFLALSAAGALSAEALAAAPRKQIVLSSTDATKGVQTVSLVANPAIQRGWVSLSAALAPPVTPNPARVHLSSAGQRQVVTGPALVPGEEILRLDEQGQPYFIIFTAETIADIARRFAEQGRQTSTNAEHSVALSGNIIDESWIVQDADNDKANALGMKVPAGTWMMSMHIPDPEYWAEHIATGKHTGFSIEGLFDTAEMKLSLKAAEAEQKPLTRFQKLFANPATRAALALAAVELKDGRVFDVAADGAVQLLDENGNATGAAPDGTYELSDGGSLEVKDGKKVTAPVEEKTAEEVKAAALTALRTLATGAETDVNALRLAVAQIITPLVGEAVQATQLDTSALKLGAEKLFLESVEMADGKMYQLNPISRRLSDETGNLLQAGEYACKDGSYFRVNVEQWTSIISKEEFEANKATATALSETKLELGRVREIVSRTPAANFIKLHSTSNGEPDPADLTPGQLRLAKAKAAQAPATT